LAHLPPNEMNERKKEFNSLVFLSHKVTHMIWWDPCEF